MVQSMPEASPAKWHLAHTTWFFETFILSESPGYKPLNPDFRYLFNSYYNAVGDRPLRQVRGAFSRPSLEEVRAYRRHVDGAMERLLASDRTREITEVATLGINHEQQHQELIITDAKHALWTNPLRPAFKPDIRPRERTAPSAVSGLHWRDYPAGLRKIGHSGAGFAFDNETPRHEVYVQAFALASRLVTNGEYVRFMEDGGYRRPELWLSDGWEVARTQQWEAPLYWERLKDGWQIYTCSGIRALSEAEPVCHVSYYEADAYARWADARLATEAEWEVAAAEVAAHGIDGNFQEEGWLHPQLANKGVPTIGLQQMFGDVWEWTQSSYAAYPGYRAAEGALGEYNAKFMCNQMVLRGGSCATPRSHIRASYRNFFPPQTRWQFSSIRLAKNAR
jgi:ergothioneine biosynthesis protein EgtB